MVLDQIGDNNSGENKSQLEFGIKVVNKDGKELGKSGTNALLITEKSAGLINIQGWYSFIESQPGVRIDETNESMLKNSFIFPKFQINTSEIDTWLKGGAELSGNWDSIKDARISQGGKLESKVDVKDLLHSKWFETKAKLKSSDFSVKISAEWISWCGADTNKRDKRLKDGKDLSEGNIGNYKKANGQVNLKASSVSNAGGGDVWALVPLYKPVIKIKFPKENMNNETIQGTLEPMKDSFLQWSTNFQPSITFSLKK